MKIFLSSASFSPSYGGPAYSVRALAEALAKGGAEVGVWAPDGSAKDLKGIVDGSNWAEVVGLAGSLKQAVREFGEPDLFHDSGLWWRHNWQIAAAASGMSKPLIISTRGMLEPAALRHKVWRKRIAWQLYQKRILRDAAALHVTSDLEAGNVRAFNLKPEIVVIANGLTVLPIAPETDRGRQKRVVFLGRMHPIKGLPTLLDAWSRIRAEGWSLVIAGPDEEGHRQELEVQAKALLIDGSVKFNCAVAGYEKQQLLSQASVFVLPSYSENFGIAAGEALAAGLPVIATKGTPWASLERERCGWHVCANVDGLEAGLRAALSSSPKELSAMGRRGHAFVARTYSWIRVADEMLEVYERVRARHRWVQYQK